MEAPALEVVGLGKSFGSVRAVDDLSFRVEPGRVTGFLGPNGSGKTTTLRMLLGLVRPSDGRALVGGHAYADHPVPGALVGAALEATGFHPGRTGAAHLAAYAPQVGADRDRCSEVLDLVGLAPAAERKVGGYSLGMRQRLGLATALLADPPALVLDEPANGLDPEGIVWLRGFLRHLASQGLEGEGARLALTRPVGRGSRARCSRSARSRCVRTRRTTSSCRWRWRRPESR